MVAKFKKWDKVNIKTFPGERLYKMFDGKINNLKIRDCKAEYSDGSIEYTVWNKDKSDYHFVYEKDLKKSISPYHKLKEGLL